MWYLNNLKLANKGHQEARAAGKNRSQKGRKKKKEEREERRKKKEEEGKLCAAWCCREKPQDRASVLHLFKVIPCNMFSWNLSSMCWEVNGIDSPIYLMKKVIAFTF